MPRTMSKKYKNSLAIFEQLESEVRAYCRSFPTVFTKAKGSKLWDEEGKEYLDFLSGAGALNYGHNNQKMQDALVRYILQDNISHSLDMATEAKRNFLEQFNEVILKPRNLQYKVMFTGPTGTNAVESALKLARKVTGRTNIISFTNGFHGMTLGSLSVTGNAMKRKGAGVPLQNTISVPFDNYFEEDFDTVEYLKQILEDSGSGLDKPAAVILETVQGEGGINAARFHWLKRIEEVCREYNILLIVDDIQAGIGRTGTFFSFEPAGIKPDIVCLSKSLSGYGLPMAITLFKPELDQWKPGEHNGTFRGNNLAFVTAAESLNYWDDDSFEKDIQKKANVVTDFLQRLVKDFPELKGNRQGRGLMQGIKCGAKDLAAKVCQEAFKRGLIMETSGPMDEVFKLFPPLTIEIEELKKGFEIIEQSIDAVVKQQKLITV